MPLQNTIGVHISISRQQRDIEESIKNMGVSQIVSSNAKISTGKGFVIISFGESIEDASSIVIDSGE